MAALAAPPFLGCCGFCAPKGLRMLGMGRSLLCMLPFIPAHITTAQV